MSGLTALEYGFPSTHSTNAVSVALYCLSSIDRLKDGMNTTSRVALQFLAWIYMLSVVLGRMYCGMHGFLGKHDCLDLIDIEIALPA
jgi:dihydrosphingosine 1-phosphate phosphatase